MKNKLPFIEGDILFNSISKQFIYVYKSSFGKLNRIDYKYMIVGDPIETLYGSSTIDELSLFMTRYGNIKDIDMTLDELKSFDIYSGDYKNKGYRKEKMFRELKMKFLLSY